LPGIALFAAIVLHKPADALAISVVLSRKGVSRTTIALVQLGFGITVAIGAMAFYFTAGHIETSLQSQLTGAALSISAGTLLFIALSDLLPEVQFHRHDRLLLFSALVAGVTLMGVIALLEPHDEGHEKHNAPTEQHVAEKPAPAQ
jgi:zinc and cadmium transporter